MISPGSSANLPTSVGNVNTSLLSSKLFALDGFTLTVGMVLVLIVVLLMWQTFFTGKRRR